MDLSLNWWAALNEDGALNMLLNAALLTATLIAIALLWYRREYFPLFLLYLLVSAAHLTAYQRGQWWLWGRSLEYGVAALQLLVATEGVLMVTFLLSCDRERTQARQGAFLIACMFLLAWRSSGPQPYPHFDAVLYYSKTGAHIACAGMLLGAIGYVAVEQRPLLGTFGLHAVALFFYFGAMAGVDSVLDKSLWFTANAAQLAVQIGCMIVQIVAISRLPVYDEKAYQFPQIVPSACRESPAEDRDKSSLAASSCE